MLKKKLFAIIIAFAMIMTCIPMMANTANAATQKYTGTFPTLPNGIEAKAIEFSWPSGTDSSVYKYPSGTSIDAYITGLDKAYPGRTNWDPATKVGASCDVFVGTVVRNSYDTKYPRGLQSQLSYLPKSSKFNQVASINTYKSSLLKAGDILVYTKKAGGAHTAIYVTINGKGYLAEAHYNRCFPAIDRKLPSFNMSLYKRFEVYRATGTCKGAIAKGQYSTSVKNLQQFLNWAGFDCETPDGAFGSVTEAAVKKYQEAVNLTADGKFGSKSLSKAKTYKRGKTSVETTVPEKIDDTQSTTVVTKEAYKGKYPTKTIKKNSGTKTNIKRWQAYLKWYGYPMTTGGTFGSSTVKYTKAFQKSVGTKADGVVGKNTITKAKAVKK